MPRQDRHGLAHETPRIGEDRRDQDHEPGARGVEHGQIARVDEDKRRDHHEGQGTDEYLAEFAFCRAFGGGATARLFQELREKRGLVYECEASVRHDGRTPLMVATAIGDLDEGREIFQYAIEALVATAESLSDDELARAMRSEIASQRMDRDMASRRIDDAIYSLIYANRIEPPRAEWAQLLALDAASVRAAGLRLLSRKPTLAAIGPVRRLPSLGQFFEADRKAA